MLSTVGSRISSLAYPLLVLAITGSARSVRTLALWRGVRSKFNRDGSEWVRSHGWGSLDDPASPGAWVAGGLLRQGATRK